MSPTTGPRTSSLHVVPGGRRPVGRVHLLRLRIAEVALVVAAAVTQVDAADERDVLLGPAGVAQDHHLLVVRAGAPHALVQHHAPPPTSFTRSASFTCSSAW